MVGVHERTQIEGDTGFFILMRELSGKGQDFIFGHELKHVYSCDVKNEQLKI